MPTWCEKTYGVHTAMHFVNDVSKFIYSSLKNESSRLRVRISPRDPINFYLLQDRDSILCRIWFSAYTSTIYERSCTSALAHFWICSFLTVLVKKLTHLFIYSLLEISISKKTSLFETLHRRAWWRPAGMYRHEYYCKSPWLLRIWGYKFIIWWVIAYYYTPLVLRWLTRCFSATAAFHRA